MRRLLILSIACVLVLSQSLNAGTAHAFFPDLGSPYTSLDKQIKNLGSQINALTNQIINNRISEMNQQMSAAASMAAAGQAEFYNNLIDLYEDAGSYCPANSSQANLYTVLQEHEERVQEMMDIHRYASLGSSEIAKRLDPAIVAEIDRMSYTDKATLYSLVFEKLGELRDTRNQWIIDHTGSCYCDSGFEANDKQTACMRNGSSQNDEPASDALPTDVPVGAWFYEPIRAFAESGYLENENTFRPNDKATRADFIKMLVDLHGGVLTTPPASPSFADVESFSSYYNYFEDAAKEGWVTGEGQCYGLSKPCYARPFDPINRAEAAALINRSFGLQAVESAPSFSDAKAGQWYTESIRVAAGNCILRGDANAGTVRPADHMTRAEMVMMLYRVDLGGMTYPNCG